MTEWLSACIKKQPKVGDALRDLTHKVRDYRDAAKPTCCRVSGSRFWRSVLALFRPGWKLLAGISIVCGIAGVIFSSFMPSYVADKWADLALAVTIPVFVLGISLVAVARSMSESGRFAVEYLNESCRMEWFCCLTFMAVLTGVVGRFLCTVEWVPNFVTVGLCAASLGAAVDCLAMLAFVVCETIRCSVPSESIKVVSKYAARRLCYGYLKEAYVRLFQTEFRSYLEKWCADKLQAIHPPSKYYGYYFRSSIHTGEGDNDVEIRFDKHILNKNKYKDYNLKGLVELDRYLKKNSAELYLSSPLYESEQGVLGILSCTNVKHNKQLQAIVCRIGNRAVRWQKYQFLEENEDFWKSQDSTLAVAIEKGVNNADPIQVRAYLDAVNEPLSVLRQVRKHKVVWDNYGDYIRKGYEFLDLYPESLKVILTKYGSESKYHLKRAFQLMRVIRSSVWNETKMIFEEMDCHTMKLFTWLAPRMYEVFDDENDKDKDIAKPFWEMRAQFGGFYEFAESWLDDNIKTETKDANEMRLVLHEGLTNWLLMAIGDQELVEQLCDADRKIVFGREGINFERGELVAQHFVLAGQLIRLSKDEKVNSTAVEKLFIEHDSDGQDVKFDELVNFYLNNSLPFKKMNKYLNIFYAPQHKQTNLFTGSSSSSGYGMTGRSEMERAFIFLAACILKYIPPPDPVANMSGEITEDNIKIVEDVFAGLKGGLNKLRTWIDNCKDLQEDEEIKQIAEANFDQEKINEWETKFWKSYSKSVPVLSMCLRNGNFKVDNSVIEKRRYTLLKMAVIDWKYPLIGAEGDRYGRSIAKDMEKEMLCQIIDNSNPKPMATQEVHEAIVKAVKWLEKEGCNIDNGIVVVDSEHGPGVSLNKDDNYMPSWREDVRSLGFDGFYQGFPLSWIRDKKRKSKESTEKVVAIDLRDWNGINVRKCVIANTAEPTFGELKIGEWKEQEIQRAINSGKLEQKDVDKAKGNCPVDVSFYWQFSSNELPRRRIFILKKGDVGEIQGDLGET